MSIHPLLSQAQQSSLKDNDAKPQFDIGDTVDVHVRILEGDKERTQVFTGIVIARRGSGTSETFTVRRIVDGEGVERVFPLHSPKIATVEVKRRAVVRRAKLFYLRERTGKQAFRLKERIVQEKTTKGRSRSRIKARKAKQADTSANGDEKKTKKRKTKKGKSEA